MANAGTAANKDGGKRLSPGGLNGLVLGYMARIIGVPFQVLQMHACQ
jgi:hypothetical protein